MVRKAGIAFLSFVLFCSLAVWGSVYGLNRTVLNPEFAIAQVDRLNVPALAADMVEGQLAAGGLPDELGFVDDALRDVVADLGPWIEDQVHTVVYSGYDYLLGRSQSLSIVFDLAPAKTVLGDTVRQAMMDNLPPEAQMLSQAELEAELDRFSGEIEAMIPDSYEINEAVIAQASPEVMDMLRQSRYYIGLTQMAYRISIGVTIGVIVGLVFLNRRRVRGATRSIGIPCLICGIGFLVCSLLAGKAVPQMTNIQGIPEQVQTAIPQIITDSVAPFKNYGIGLMAAGITLLVVSVAYKRGWEEDS